MSLNTVFTRSIALFTLSTAALMASVAYAQTAAQPYVTLEQAQPTNTTGKTEVLEFFAYSCSHCNTMEPMVAKWAETFPEDVVLNRVPVAFNASMADLQRLYYSLESMDRLDLHPAVFKAIHSEGQRIYTAPVIFKWIAEQGVDRQAFEDTFNSFGVQSKVTRASELAKTYKIEGTPSLAVAGKYVTSPTLTNSYEGTIVQAQKLLDMANK